MKCVCTSMRPGRPARRRKAATRSRSCLAVSSRKIRAHSEPLPAASASSRGSSVNMHASYCVTERSACGTDGVPRTTVAS